MNTSIDLEPRTYVWLVESEPYTGTLWQYAHAIESAHYAGMSVSDCVWRAEGGRLAFHIPAISEPTTADDYGYTTIAVGDDVATVKIDLRA